MSRVIIDAALRSKLLGCDKPLELCDETGKVIARIIPVINPAEYEPMEPQISDEELRRRMQSNEKMYTTAEVLAYLEKL